MGRALYDFHSNRTDEISLSTGDIMVGDSYKTHISSVKLYAYWGISDCTALFEYAHVCV